MTIFSDRFARLANPGYTETLEIDGSQFKRPKAWSRYTLEEKAQCISRATACPAEIALMLMNLESEIETLKGTRK